MLELYKNIKNFRIALNMTQDELAKKVGYADKGMISRVENGKIDLSQSLIVKFADALNVTPSQLMGYDQFESATDPETIAKAMELYKKYEKLTPENQKAFQTLLKSLQSDT